MVDKMFKNARHVISILDFTADPEQDVKVIEGGICKCDIQVLKKLHEVNHTMSPAVYIGEKKGKVRMSDTSFGETYDVDHVIASLKAGRVLPNLKKLISRDCVFCTAGRVEDARFNVDLTKPRINLL
jgi:hypothetical protein